jgi:hypothetical protein
MGNRLASKINLWVILGGLLVASGLIFLLGLVIFLVPLPAAEVSSGQVQMTVIPAPTSTLVPTRVIFTPTPTRPPAIDGIYVSSYVQITGTDGAGLRLRSGPGTTNPPRLLGMEDEVFQVKDGPQTSDEFTWWYLEAPYDPERSGWAASKFLKVVNPPETPAP